MRLPDTLSNMIYPIGLPHAANSQSKSICLPPSRMVTSLQRIIHSQELHSHEFEATNTVRTNQMDWGQGVNNLGGIYSICEQLVSVTKGSNATGGCLLFNDVVKLPPGGVHQLTFWAFEFINCSMSFLSNTWMVTNTFAMPVPQAMHLQVRRCNKPCNSWLLEANLHQRLVQLVASSTAGCAESVCQCVLVAIVRLTTTSINHIFW